MTHTHTGGRGGVRVIEESREKNNNVDAVKVIFNVADVG